jgi:hypothetical protein
LTYVDLVGIHVGYFPIPSLNNNYYRVFSPWQGIQTDLNLQTGINIYATEQSTGNSIPGLYVTVYNSNNQLVGSGYTPLSVPLSSSGTYTVNYDNYGSYYFTSSPPVKTTTSSYVYSWGGQVKVSYTSGDVLNVDGIYYNNNNPGNYALVQFKAHSTSCNCDPSPYVGEEDSYGNVYAQGFTPYSIGLPTGTSVTVDWDNGGSYVISSATTNPSTLQTSFTTASWGAMQTIQPTTAGGSAGYSDQGNYS